jgi:hypothetical protein
MLPLQPPVQHATFALSSLDLIEPGWHAADYEGEHCMSSRQIDWSGELVVCVTPFAKDRAFAGSALVAAD